MLAKPLPDAQVARMASELEWRVSPERVDYGTALAEMEARAAAVDGADQVLRLAAGRTGAG